MVAHPVVAAVYDRRPALIERRYNLCRSVQRALWYHWYMRVPSVRKLRRRLGLSQRELAGRLGVARATVTRWENGTRRPSKLAEMAIQSMVEVKDAGSWQRLSALALNELWNNSEDAVYDTWQKTYAPGSR